MENKVQTYLDLGKKILKLYTDGAEDQLVDLVYDEMDAIWASCSADEKESIRLEAMKEKEQ